MNILLYAENITQCDQLHVTLSGAGRIWLLHQYDWPLSTVSPKNFSCDWLLSRKLGKCHF